MPLPAGRGRPPQGGTLKAAAKIALVATAFWLFVLSLEMIKRSASGLGPLMAGLHVDGAPNLFGFGWLMAYVVLSGSPVAAVALGLFGGGLISDTETLAMIAGSRFGAAFVVLLAGTIHYMRRSRQIVTVATGVLALLVTWTVYAPATLGAYALLASGSFSGLRIQAPAAFDSFQSVVVNPAVDAVAGFLHPLLLFAAGVGVLVGAFSLFDKTLPEINPQQGRFRQIADIVYRPKVMFLLGVAVTCLTLSVSVSVGLLVPIAAKGYIRRENVVPYVMGANISTFIDTLFASLLVGEPRAASVVAAQLVSVSAVSLVILLFFYRPYRRLLEAALETVIRSRQAFLVFLGITMAIPLVFLIT